MKYFIIAVSALLVIACAGPVSARRKSAVVVDNVNGTVTPVNGTVNGTVVPPTSDVPAVPKIPAVSRNGRYLLLLNGDVYDLGVRRVIPRSQVYIIRRPVDDYNVEYIVKRVPVTSSVRREIVVSSVV